MTRQIVLHPPLRNRREPLLPNQSSTAKSGDTRFAEVAGGTTASCAAICCCCPCGLVKLLVLAVYKLPAGLCRKALKKKRRRKLKKAGLLVQRRRCSCGCDEADVHLHPVSVDVSTVDYASNESDASEKQVMELEKEMWDRFHNSGFWRSPSRNDV